MLTSRAPLTLPRAERAGTRVSYRDALVATLAGYRPLLLDLVVPAGQAPGGGHPVVVYLYGGAPAAGSHKHSLLGDRVTDRLLAAGFAVARAQYRHGREAPFPAQVHDVKAAVRWVRHHAGELELDADRVAAWGHSAGGYLAAMLAVTADDPEFEGDLGITGPPSRVGAAIAWSAPADFTRIPPPPAGSPLHSSGHDPHDWLPGPTASPLLHASATAAPLLLAHGTDDAGIPIAHSEALVAAYWRAGADADLVRIEGAGHFYGERKLQHVTDAGIAFLRNHLTAEA
ncbi:prolyl oligopeptidase family serine peptidase [Amycolatopsis sp. RTGN1]|uniref:prolyl oligopeptidase family serine peptidase n=1 Tax=Amycolatopsis ponsaeliensis TaxID=2992142 RepID=UPI00254BE312|nr:alpha/beta hydrolase fold domain-containing protein [Amycolatopsis sp. RTGN1]